MTPKYGDVLIRGDLSGGFEIVDALTLQPLSQQHCSTLAQAIVIARMKGGRIWQQQIDHRGRPLAPPAPLAPSGT